MKTHSKSIPNVTFPQRLNNELKTLQFSGLCPVTVIEVKRAFHSCVELILFCFPSVQVHLASSPVLDAWYGARDWAVEYMAREEGWITRKDYEEKGGEYLKEHCASNVYVPIRLPKQAPRTTDALAPSRALTSSTACEQA